MLAKFNAMPAVANNDLVVGEVAADDKAGRLAARAIIEGFQSAFQDAIGSEHGDADEINRNGLKEYLVGGAYIRELFIPADTIIVSKIWKKQRLWIIASGEVTLKTETGSQRVIAPFVKVAELGSKVAMVTHSDTLLFAITGSKADQLEDVENEVVTNDYRECDYPWDKLEHQGRV